MSEEFDPRDVIRSKELAELMAPHGAATVIPYDPDLAGATVGQAYLLIPGIPDQTPELCDEITFAANAVAVKLAALRYHQKRFEEIQRRRLEELLHDFEIQAAMQRGVKICELELLFELESYWLQFKSTLDMLVKVFGAVAGTKAGVLSSYGRGGTRVIKHLRSKKNDKRLTPGRIDWLIELIEKAGEQWLESMIRIRDTISHYKPYIHFGFTWDPSVSRVVVPKTDDPDTPQPIIFVMERNTEGLIRFCTEFIAIAISCAIPLERCVKMLEPSELKMISVKWGMDLSRAVWGFSSNVIREYSEEEIAQAKRERKTLTPM